MNEKPIVLLKKIAHKKGAKFYFLVDHKRGINNAYMILDEPDFAIVDFESGKVLRFSKGDHILDCHVVEI